MKNALRLGLVILLLALAALPALAQGGGEAEEPVLIDWCDLVNGRRGLVVALENALNTSYDRLLRSLNDGSLEESSGPAAAALVRRLLGGDDAPDDLSVPVPPLEQFVEPGGEYTVTIPAIGFLGLNEARTVTVRVVDYGVECATGDKLGVVRLWDDKMTLVILRALNDDLAFYRVDGSAIATVPYWAMIGPFEAGQMIFEYAEYERLFGAALRLYYLGEGDLFQMNWYGPDGGLVYAVPFTYPDPCPALGVGESDDPGVPRICAGWTPPW